MFQNTQYLESKINFNEFIKPFSLLVWIIVLVTIVITGVEYYIIYEIYYCKYSNNMQIKMGDTIFKIFLAFIG